MTSENGAVRTADAPETVLVLNRGSSSLKFGLFAVGESRTDELFAGEIEQRGAETAALEQIEQILAARKCAKPTAIGHRIVHGGFQMRDHCLIDLNTIALIEQAAAFAPIHDPAALALIRLAGAHFTDLPQVACFDTAFHATLPEIAHVLPIPREYRADGVRRYGFHGLSCESVVRHLAATLPSRLVVAHLGNGSSVTAIKDGRSIDTSMGLTPSGGVVMGSRSGDLDPGVLLYLLREKHFDAAKLADLIDFRSGMLGISGISGDMRRLHEAEPDSADARLAVAMFCYSTRKQIAGMIAALGGIDMLVFTGGIGENDAVVRAEICDGLEWLSGFTVCVVPSREDEMIARHTYELVKKSHTCLPRQVAER